MESLEKRLLTLSPYCSNPPISGGTKRIHFLNRGYALLGWKVLQISGTTVHRGVLDLFRSQGIEVVPDYREEIYFNPLVIMGNRLLRGLDTAQTAASLLPKALLKSRRVATAMARYKIVLFEHPHYFEIAKPWLREDHIVVLDAHNIETEIYDHRLKQSGLAGIAARRLRGIEQSCMARADLVFTCSSGDRDATISRFGVKPERVHVAPNGVDLASVPFVSDEKRRLARQKLGLKSETVALFVGARWGPNLEAARQVLAMAQVNRSITYLIVGSVGDSLSRSQLPDNVIVTGMIDDLRPWFAAADIAINPMESGSGSNIKMFEYCAAGLPVISTAFGARGIEDDSGKVLTICSIPEMPEAIIALARSADLCERRTAARMLVQEKYDWTAIARQVSETILAEASRKVR